MAAAAVALVGPRSLRHNALRAFASLYLYPTLRRNCQWHGPVVTRFRTRQREVWLTIDDGPDARCCPDFLEVLAAHDAKASFFAIGRLVDAHRRVAGQLVEAGHSIENHTQNHPSGWWWAADPWTVAREIASCSHAIRTATGMEPRMFRSPVGMTNPWVHRASAAAGLRVVGWSVSGGDACAVAPSRFVATLMRAISPGAIVLLHVGEGARHRCHALSLLLRELQADGYRCVLPHQEALC